MATAFKGTAAATGIPAEQSIRENTVAGQYAVLAALVVNDTIDLCPLPAGCMLTQAGIIVPDLDSNGTPLLAFDLQYKTLTTKIITAAIIGQAAGIVAWPAVVVAATNGTVGAGPGLLSAADTLQLLVSIAPATGATSGTIKYWVKYTTDVQYLS